MCEYKKAEIGNLKEGVYERKDNVPLEAKIIINVEEYQKDLFEPLLRDEMTFYYDESGNCRKFRLTNRGFNDPNALVGNFVLGGVAFEGKNFVIDKEKLYKSLNFNKTQKEMKFEHLYSNSKDFISFMKSDRATIFLNWLSKSGLYIHYFALNNLYYSLVDIVDSLPVDQDNRYLRYCNEIKSALYAFVIKHRDVVTKFLIKHEYPNVKDPSIFCRELRSLIKKYTLTQDAEYFFCDMLCCMLEQSERHEELPFIQNNETGELIEGYYHFYLLRCQEFSKSLHIFDEEHQVQERMSEYQLYENGKPLDNWTFINSREDPFIQISDMVVGLLRKLFLYLDQNSVEKIKSDCSGFDEVQFRNFSIITNLITRSQEKHIRLFLDCSPIKVWNERTIKLRYLSDPFLNKIDVTNCNDSIIMMLHEMKDDILQDIEEALSKQDVSKQDIRK